MILRFNPLWNWYKSTERGPRAELKGEGGELLLAGVVWNGKEIVSADWVKWATTPVVVIDPNRSYGYGWYMGDGQPPRQLHWMA